MEGVGCNVYVICLESRQQDRGDPTCAHYAQSPAVGRVFAFPAVTPEDFVLDEVTHPFARATIHPSAFDKDGPRVAERERRSREMTIQLSHETQVGCALSHISLWNLCKDTDKPLIIAEDDSRPGHLDRRLSFLESDPVVDEADLVVLQCASYPFSADAPGTDGGSALHRVRDYWGANAYYLKPSGTEKLLQNALPITMHIDCYMAYCITGADLKVFSVPDANDQSVFLPSTLMHNSVWGVRVVRLQIYVVVLGALLVITLAVVMWLACRKQGPGQK